MDTQEKTLAKQFCSLRIAAHHYLRGRYRKAAEERSKESREEIRKAAEETNKEIMDKIFSCLSEEEQKTMRSYLKRVVEALKSETKESDDDDYDFPFDKAPMDFVRLMDLYHHRDGFGYPCRRYGAHGHGGERMNGFMMPF
jgi:hypothetical protein